MRDDRGFAVAWWWHVRVHVRVLHVLGSQERRSLDVPTHDCGYAAAKCWHVQVSHVPWSLRMEPRRATGDPVYATAQCWLIASMLVAVMPSGAVTAPPDAFVCLILSGVACVFGGAVYSVRNWCVSGGWNVRVGRLLACASNCQRDISFHCCPRVDAPGLNPSVPVLLTRCGMLYVVAPFLLVG